jgi:acetyl-CoA synthetase
MAATYKMAAYPKEISFRDGSTATVRPLEPGDADGLLEFFLSVPEEDRFFLKDDVASPAQIREWTQHLNFAGLAAAVRALVCRRSAERFVPVSGPAHEHVDSYDPSDDLVSDVKSHMRETIGPIGVPEDIFFVRSLPKTRGGKIMRRVIAAVASDREVGDLTTLEDEATVDEARRAYHALREAVDA